MDGGASRGLIGPDPVVIVDAGYSLGIGKTGAFRGENSCISTIERGTPVDLIAGCILRLNSAFFSEIQST